MSDNPFAPPQSVVHDVSDPRDQMVLADRGVRLGASILDGLIFAGMVYLPLILGTGAGVILTGDVPRPTPALIVGGGLALVGMAIWAWLNIKFVLENGQSIAKRLLGIKVVRTDGSPITLGRIFWLRNVVNSLISLVPLYGIIEVLFIFSENRQCLHDKLADTLVIKA